MKRILMALIAAVAQGQVTQHIVLLEPSPEQLSVRETFFCTAAFEAFVPEGAKFDEPPPKTAKANVYRFACPAPAEGAKEGRVDFRYVLPAAAQFRGKVLYKGLDTRFVVPAGFVLESEGIERIEAPRGMRANIFRVSAPEYTVAIGVEEEASDGPGIERIYPRIYNRLAEILGLSFLVLLLGFFLLYRRKPV
jgi:hypothetical protein